MVTRSIRLICFFCIGTIAGGAWANPDPTTLDGKVLFGYQGWFDCPGSWNGNWSHWSGGVPSPSTLGVDMYPDLSEFPKSDLCQAGNFTINGAPAYLFSARNPNIVDMHFKWMRDYGLDGVLIQRFLTDLPGLVGSGDVTLKNILAASVKYGRVVAIEYDVTGSNFTTWQNDLEKDWKYLVDSLKVTSRASYLHQKGKPLVSIWGMGLNETRNPPTNPAEALTLVNWFHADAAAPYRATVMGGVPAGFRTLNRDARTDSAWLPVYRAMDAVQPWNVGRESSLADVKGWWKTNVNDDQKWLAAAGVTYMPVIFPGFSWVNASKGQGKLNQIPRLGGDFIWQQAMITKAAGVGAVKIAMFDEVNESTSMFKIVSKRSQAPTEGQWLTLDADSLDLPSDWYLRVAGEITKITHGLQAASDKIPINPKDPYPPSAIKAGMNVNSVPSGLRWERVSGEIRFTTLAKANAILITDTQGVTVKELSIRSGRAAWDMRNARGEAVKAGVYIARLMGNKGEAEARNAGVILIP